MAKPKLVELSRAFLARSYAGGGTVERFKLGTGTDRFEVLVSGGSNCQDFLIFSPGFGSALKDYGPLVRVLERRFRVVRLTHPGSTRATGLKCLFRTLFLRFCKGLSRIEAALELRKWIHRPSNRKRRLEHLTKLHQHLRRSYSVSSLSVAGHSFGTDTAILFALEEDVERLFLFSPHPPDYLIPKERYKQVQARGAWVIVGSQDFTKDGVGPEERTQVTTALRNEVLQDLIVLPDVCHMDFALDGLGPEGWERDLSVLVSTIGHVTSPEY